VFKDIDMSTWFQWLCTNIQYNKDKCHFITRLLRVCCLQKKNIWWSTDITNSPFVVVQEGTRLFPCDQQHGRYLAYIFLLTLRYNFFV
jgi:hypothetical protein